MKLCSKRPGFHRFASIGGNPLLFRLDILEDSPMSLSMRLSAIWSGVGLAVESFFTEKISHTQSLFRQTTRLSRNRQTRSTKLSIAPCAMYWLRMADVWNWQR